MDNLNIICDHFEVYLKKNLPQISSFHPHYNISLGEMLLCGGKRFRPRLTLCVVQSLKPQMIENSFPVALAIECLHTYSLIHDDLPSMDNADLRRGHQTLHKKYDEVTAILAGDALNTYSFYLLATSPLDASVKVELIKLLSENGGMQGMVHGQALDCHFATTKLSIEQLKILHENKTAKLIAASLAMGAVIANASNEIKEKLFTFGMLIGLLFQVRDDIIDVVSSEEEAGKSVRSDEFKNSFVNLLGLNGARDKLNELISKTKIELETFPKLLSENLLAVLSPYLNQI